MTSKKISKQTKSKDRNPKHPLVKIDRIKPKQEFGQLAPKRKLFVSFYIGEAAGNATKAARMAGYSPKSAHVTGSRLLKRRDVQEALKVTVSSYSGVADLEDLLLFLSTVMFDVHDEHPTAHRLKAADQLAKCAGYYTRQKEDVKDVAIDVYYPDPDPVEDVEDLLSEDLPEIEFPTFSDEEMEE